MTLMRVVMAKARWRGGGTISYSTPSALMRILNSLFERFEVQVAGVVLDGQQQHHVQQLAHRGAVGQGLDAGQVEGVGAAGQFGLGGQLGVVGQVIDDRLDALVAGVVAFERLEHVVLGGHHPRMS